MGSSKRPLKEVYWSNRKYLKREDDNKVHRLRELMDPAMRYQWSHHGVLIREIPGVGVVGMVPRHLPILTD